MDFLSKNQSLRWSDVIWGSAIAILAALASGLWPWMLLSAFAAKQLQGEKRQQIRQALYLLLAIGLHEAVIRVCGDVFGDALLGIDAVPTSGVFPFTGNCSVLVLGCYFN